MKMREMIMSVQWRHRDTRRVLSAPPPGPVTVTGVQMPTGYPWDVVTIEYLAAGAPGTSHECWAQGCKAPELEAMLARTLNVTQELLKEQESRMQPTKALWCEQGGHPFSEKDPDVQVLTITGRDADGKTVEESRTSCGECAALARTRLGKVRNAQASELPSGDA